MQHALVVALVVAVPLGCRAPAGDEAGDGGGAAAEPTAPAASPSPSPPAPGPVTIGRVPPRPGATVTERSEFEMRVDVHHVVDDEAGPSFERHSIDRTEKRVTVLEVDARGAVTRARVAYDARAQSQTQGGESQQHASPLVGRSYLVEAVAPAAGGDAEPTLRVRYESAPVLPDDDEEPEPEPADAAGSDPLEPAPGEVAEVQLDNRGLGRPDALREMLPSTALQPGQPVELAAGPVARLFAQGSSRAEVERATLSLRETRGGEDGAPRLAVLDASLVVRVRDGEAMSTRLELEGELTVQIETGWVESMTLQGPVETAGTQRSDGSTTRMSGSGTVAMRYHARYSE